MSTKIEWTHIELPDGRKYRGDVWNAIIGCDKISEGCKNCYAITTAWIRSHNPHPTMQQKFAGTVEKTKGGKLNWTGHITFSEEALLKPLKTKHPTCYFVNSMSDLFHEKVTVEMIAQIYAVMYLCPQHIFQILTKRDERMYVVLTSDEFKELLYKECNSMHDKHIKPLESELYFYDEIMSEWPLKNVWQGVSVENQDHTPRIVNLTKTPAAVRFLSCEPLLGGLDITNKGLKNGYSIPTRYDERGKGIEWTDPGDKFIGIDWVICGGESGPDARPMHPDWVRSLRDQCKEAGVPFFFKQWGGWREYIHDAGDNARTLGRFFGSEFKIGNYIYTPENPTCMAKVGKKAAGRLLDGVEHNEFPQTENVHA